MSNSNGIIKAPISLAGDVYKVLGIAPQNGVYDIGYSCSNKHDRINRFSLKKPVRIGVLSTTSDDQFAANNCGLATVQAVIAGTPPKLVCEPWGYEPPTGGLSSPYRITDFNGYNHNAVAPIQLDTYEITYDKSGGLDNLIVSARFLFRELSGDVSYGDTSNVDISIDQLVVSQSRFIWWGLAYVNNMEILVANSDNNLDQSDKGTNYSPGIVKLKDWKLGEFIQSQSAGKSIELVPVINIRPEGGGRPNGIDKNGGINAETALCFPEGRKLVIKIIESPTGIFAQATWSLSGPITIYFRNNEIGHFAIGSEGYFDQTLVGAQSNVVKLEMGVLVSPKKGSFDIIAQNWIIDFSQFPHDPNYEIGALQCNGVTFTKGGTTSLNLTVSQSTMVYFTAECSLLSLMQSFWTQSSYRGIVSLTNSASGQTAANDYYNIPSTSNRL